MRVSRNYLSSGPTFTESDLVIRTLPEVTAFIRANWNNPVVLYQYLRTVSPDSNIGRSALNDAFQSAGVPYPLRGQDNGIATFGLEELYQRGITDYRAFVNPSSSPVAHAAQIVNNPQLLIPFIDSLGYPVDSTHRAEGALIHDAGGVDSYRMYLAAYHEGATDFIAWRTAKENAALAAIAQPILTPIITTNPIQTNTGTTMDAASLYRNYPASNQNPTLADLAYWNGRIASEGYAAVRDNFNAVVSQMTHTPIPASATQSVITTNNGPSVLPAITSTAQAETWVKANLSNPSGLYQFSVTYKLTVDQMAQLGGIAVSQMQALLSHGQGVPGSVNVSGSISKPVLFAGAFALFLLLRR